MARVAAQGHPFERHGEIRSKLSGMIRSGSKPPGSRLPTRLELAAEFRTSPVTIQKALVQLVADGFVKVRGRAGTFVAERPPHLYRFGLVISTPGPMGFVRALVEQTDVLRRTRHWQFPIYSNATGSTDSVNYRNMVDDLRYHRLAGLILTQPPSYYLDTPLFTERDLPRVAIVDHHQVPGVGCVRLDSQMFVDKALDYLKARGRRRVALVATPNFSSGFVDVLTDGTASRGLTIRPGWSQALDHRSQHWAPHVVAALLNSPVNARPDGMIIADDHLVESVTNVLHRRCRPTELDVVAHCNFPKLPTAAWPVNWLGYDVRQVLEVAVTYIQQSLTGFTPEPVTIVPAQFASELSNSVRPQMTTKLVA